MSNQTLLPVEKGYPERQALPEAQTLWDINYPAYFHAPVYARGNNLFDLLDEAGLEVNNEAELRVLGSLTTAQAVEVYGPVVEKIRHPLGRTGIQGTGIFYHAGEAPAADMAITRWHPEVGRQIALVYSRRWGLPGGFCEGDESAFRRRTAVREAQEETGIDLYTIPLAFPLQTLVPLHVKPNSKRSTDYGFITTQVEYAALHDYRDGDSLLGADDAEAAGWFTAPEVRGLWEDRTLSNDHFGYIQRALEFTPPATV